MRRPALSTFFWSTTDKIQSPRDVSRRSRPSQVEIRRNGAEQARTRVVVSQFRLRRLALLPSTLLMERSLRCQLGVLNVDRVLPSRTRTDALLSESRPSPTPQSPELGGFGLDPFRLP